MKLRARGPLPHFIANRAAYQEERRAMVPWWASYIETAIDKRCVASVDQGQL